MALHPTRSRKLPRVFRFRGGRGRVSFLVRHQMSKTLNWKKIGLFAVALFLAEVLVGFITGGPKAELRLVASLALSLCLSSVLFWLMAVGQSRPFLHASLALLGTFMFSLALGAVLPAWLVETPVIFAVLEWLTLVVGLILGTSIGRYVGLRRARADA